MQDSDFTKHENCHHCNKRGFLQNHKEQKLSLFFLCERWNEASRRSLKLDTTEMNRKSLLEDEMLTAADQ